MNDQPWMIPAIVLGFCVVFPLFWCGVVWLISRMGWAALARRHTAIRPIEGKRYGGCSGLIGMLGSRYKHVLNVIVGTEGLYLSVNPLFRIGHDPLLIPWDRLKEVSESDFLFVKRLRVRVESEGTGLAVYLPVEAAAYVPKPRV